MKRESLIVLALASPLAFLMYGITLGAFVTIGFMTLLMVIADYFSARREEDKPPSTFERTFAYIWVWIRRAVCWPLGGLFVYVGIFDLTPPGVVVDSPRWQMRLFTILLGGFLIYIGFVGQGDNRSALRDDLHLHRKNKRRYKLWF